MASSSFASKPSRGRSQGASALAGIQQRQKSLSLKDIKLENGFTKDCTVPDSVNKVREIATKCAVVAKGYDIVQVEEIRDIVIEIVADLPKLVPKSEGPVSVTSVENGPTKFYLRWKFQDEVLLLLDHWLTDSVQFKKLKIVQTTDERSLMGNVFAAPRPPTVTVISSVKKDVLFARGRVTGFENEAGSSKSATSNKVKIYFVDYGDQELLDLSSLYIIPSQIAKLPPLCFSAYLVNFEAPTDEKESVISSQFQILSKVNNQQMPSSLETKTAKRDLICTIKTTRRVGVGSSSASGGSNYGVELRKRSKLSPNETSLEIGEELTKLFKATLSKEVPRNQLADQIPQGKIMVQPYLDSDYRTLKRFRVLRIVSPGDFVLQLIPNDEKVVAWKREMQNTYNRVKSAGLHTFEITGSLIPNRCYAWFNSDDQSWNRVRMRDPFTQPSKIWDLDRCCSAWADFSDLRELSQSYFIAPAMATKAHLVHVQPKNRAQKWSGKATMHFQSLCPKDKIFYGVTLEKVEDGDVSYGVVLTEKSEDYHGSVQSQLVRDGVAEATGPASGAHDIAYPAANGVPLYERQELETELGTKIDSEKLLKKRIVRVHLYEPSLNPCDKPLLNQIPDAVRLKMGAIRITTTGSGPGNFCILMENKFSAFTEMSKDLDMLAESEFSSAVPLWDVKPGYFAIAKALDENTYANFVRVMILTVDVDAPSCTAVFIDYGSVLPINPDTIREIPPYFKDIPSFCHRVHLDLAEINDLSNPSDLEGIGSGVRGRFGPSGNTKWTESANTSWRRYLNAWQNPSPLYHAWQGQLSSSIQLTEFNQNLLFNPKTMTWLAAKPKKDPTFAVMNQQRDHPLLQQFYSSIGVSLVYETVGRKPTSFHTFESVLPFLKKLGYVIEIQ